jgi:hypothetical protein
MQLQSTLTCPKCSYQAVETMPASSSMTARAVANGSSPSLAIAACSALTVQCRARRHRATCVAACQTFNKCSEAPKREKRPADVIDMARADLFA